MMINGTINLPVLSEIITSEAIEQKYCIFFFVKFLAMPITILKIRIGTQIKTPCKKTMKYFELSKKRLKKRTIVIGGIKIAKMEATAKPIPPT